MKIKILGCGPILQQAPWQNCSGYLVDNQFLFDCGPGIWQALNEQGITPSRLHNIFLTHFHIDHTSDLAPLLMARFLSLEKLNRDLLISGPEGLKNWYQHFSLYCGSWITKLPTKLTEINAEILCDDYRIRSLPTGHTDTSVCYRISDRYGKAFFYSGDTGFNTDIIVLMQDCDLAILEASNTEDLQVTGHLTPSQAGQLAARAGVKRLILTHRYPEVNEDYARNSAAKFFKGEIDIAADGKLIKV